MNSALEVFDRVRGYLVASGHLTAAKSGALTKPQSQAEIVDRLLVDEIPPRALAEAISRATDLPLFQEGDTAAVSGSDWIIANNRLYLVNPLGPRVVDVKEKRRLDPTIYAFNGLGVISQDQVASVTARYQIETEVRQVDEDQSYGQKLFDEIMKTAIAKGASDVHIFRNTREGLIRLKVDGICQMQHTAIPKERYLTLSNVIMTAANLNAGQFLRPLDGEFSYKLDQREIRVRLGMLPTKVGTDDTVPKFTLRLLGLDARLTTLPKLGLSQTHLAIAERAFNRPSGLILVTGPTGSGKTTTLYAALRHIFDNHPDKVFYTAEDPVEIAVPGFHQVQINDQAERSFGATLRALLRADPDVILVGEIRDEETAALALKGSMTGHLVLSTLHTNSSIDTISRLQSMGVDMELLANNLVAVTAQRTVRKVCAVCATPVPFDQVGAKYRNVPNAPSGEVLVANKQGCIKCHGGYRGRRIVAEFIELSPKTTQLISQKESLTNIKEHLYQEERFEDMWVDGMRLLGEHETTIEALEEKLSPIIHYYQVKRKM